MTVKNLKIVILSLAEQGVRIRSSSIGLFFLQAAQELQKQMAVLPLLVGKPGKDLSVFWVG